MSQSLQTVLSHVIEMTESLDNMQHLQQALLQSKATPQGQMQGSALASVAELKLRSMQFSPGKQATEATDKSRDHVVSLDGTLD